MCQREREQKECRRGQKQCGRKGREWKESRREGNEGKISVIGQGWKGRELRGVEGKGMKGR